MAFVPTHQAPDGGLAAWAYPDSRFPPALRLAACVPLQLEETRGTWARVTDASGGMSWVDAHRLVGLGAVRAPVEYPPAQVLAATGPSPVGLTSGYAAPYPAQAYQQEPVRRRLATLIKVWLWSLPVLVGLAALAPNLFGIDDLNLPFVGSLLTLLPLADVLARALTLAFVVLAVLLWLAWTIYWLPTLIAYGRHTAQRTVILLLNLFLSWTVIGWFAALIWAIAGRSEPLPGLPIQYSWSPSGPAGYYP